MQHNAEPAIGLLETIFASPGLTTALASLAGILLTALIGLSLRIREERAKHGVRSADLFSSAYHEIAISFATVSGMAQHLQLDIFLEEIKRNNKYFPHWPAYTSMLFVFENEIKKETLALPVYLKPYLYDFYQNSIYYSQLLTDLRSDVTTVRLKLE